MGWMLDWQKRWLWVSLFAAFFLGVLEIMVLIQQTNVDQVFWDEQGRLDFRSSAFSQRQKRSREKREEFFSFVGEESFHQQNQKMR